LRASAKHNKPPFTFTVQGPKNCTSHCVVEASSFRCLAHLSWGERQIPNMPPTTWGMTRVVVAHLIVVLLIVVVVGGVLGG